LKNRKLLIRIIIVIAISTAIVFFLRSLVRGFAGDWIVNILQEKFHLKYDDARIFYHELIRSNLDVIIVTTIIVISVFLSLILILYSRNQRAKDAKIAEQRKNELVAYLAHDIKTPLTSVIGYLSLLHEAPDMPPEQKEKYINITLEKAYRLQTLVDEFFEISRYSFQSNLQSDSLSKENIDLYYMLMQMTDEFYPILFAKGKKAVLNVPEDFTIHGDPNKLARVFNNILKNAAAYSTDNSVIEISAAKSVHISSIVFTNDGSIPKEELALIFDKFYRLDSARSSNTGGAGLGLAIAKEIVLSHGGRIYANSDGKSTSFTVELPILSKI